MIKARFNNIKIIIINYKRKIELNLIKKQKFALSNKVRNS